jgi:hypothetical protein
LRSSTKNPGLHIQILYDEPKCFDTFIAHYGKFSGVNNYIALVGKNPLRLMKNWDTMGAGGLKGAGAWTEYLLGGHDPRKKAQQRNNQAKLCVPHLIGYGTTDGVPHKSKSVAQVRTIKPECQTGF